MQAPTNESRTTAEGTLARAPWRRRHGWPCLLAAIACTTLVAAGGEGEVAATAPFRHVPIHVHELEVDAARTWATNVTVPVLAPDEAPVLALRARVQTADHGGCNYVLQVLFDGLPLSEDPLRPRLLNKAPWFDPPGTSYHFSWFSAEQQGWMTIFAPAFSGNWGGTGQDYEFRFDLTGLVTGGQALPIAFRYLNPDIPVALGVARAPLTLDRVLLEVLPLAEVERLRRAALQGQSLRAVPVTVDLPAGARPGERPYEIVWSGRKESPPAQVGFDDLAGWTAQALGDTQVALAASVDRRLWRPQLAKLS